MPTRQNMSAPWLLAVLVLAAVAPLFGPMTPVAYGQTVPRRPTAAAGGSTPDGPAPTATPRGAQAPGPASAPSAGDQLFPETGFAVSDAEGVLFLSEFRRLGGVQAVGYPASRRFQWDGFTVQVFQRVVFQWRPDVRQAYFVNVFDRLHESGKDDWLLGAKQTPRHDPTLGDLGARLLLLDERPAIKAKFYAVVGDALQANGAPTSRVRDMGNHYALRAQRVVFQEWKEDVPWARKGEVTVALGGDIAKEARILPSPEALVPDSPARAANPRFGVAIAAADGAAVEHAALALGAGSWFSYGPPTAAGPPGRTLLARTGRNASQAGGDAELQAAARARPGSYWLVGNEPNVHGQDFDPTRSVAENAAEYAASYRRYRAAVLAADSTARFVIGNTMNLDALCRGCDGQVPGRAFLDAFLAAYGEPIPPDTIWGVHAYAIDWDRLPMTDTAEPIRQVEAFRAYVDALPGQRGKPIWLTEFGVVWGYPRLCWLGEKITGCGEPRDEAAMERYLATMLDWLLANGGRLGLERWFLFANAPAPEPFAAEYGGIDLMDGPGPDASLTRFGRLFAERARSGR